MDGVFLLPLDVEHLHPFLRRLVPHDLGIAIAAGDLFQDRIAAVFGEVPSVRAMGDGLHGGISGGGVDQHERRFAVLAKAAGVLPIDDGAAAEHRAHVVRREFVTELLPVNHVAADGVAPVHVAPTPAVGIVLEEQVILAVEVNHPVRVIVPTPLR